MDRRPLGVAALRLHPEPTIDPHQYAWRANGAGFCLQVHPGGSLTVLGRTT
jgi:hypothetical protein